RFAKTLLFSILQRFFVSKLRSNSGRGCVCARWNIGMMGLIFLLLFSTSSTVSANNGERPARFDTIKDTVCTGEMIRVHQEVDKWKNKSRWRITYESGKIIDSLQYPFSCKIGGWIQLTHFLELEGKLDSFSRSLFVATTPDAELPQ